MMKILLDAAHTKNYNQGANKKYYEGNAMFYLACYLKKELEKYENTSVFLTRERPEDFLEAEERGTLARELCCDTVLSLHSAGSARESASGVSVFRSVKREDSSLLAMRLAYAAARTMNAVTGCTYMRGDKPQTRTVLTTGNDYYGVLRAAVRAPSVRYAILLEHGFHTNKSECLFLCRKKNLKALARAEAAAIARYFGLFKKKALFAGLFM